MYSSEPLFSGDMLLGMILLLGMAVSVCLPAVLCFRAGKNGMAAGCLALGLTGILLYIPWIIAVVLAARNVEFRDTKETDRFRNAGRILGLAVLALGVILLVLAMGARSDVSGSNFEDFYMVTIINGFIGGGYLCVIGVITALCAFSRGKGFWGWYTALPYLLCSGISSVGKYALFWRFAGSALMIAGSVYVWIQVFRSVQREGNGAGVLSSLASSVQKATETVRTPQNVQMTQAPRREVGRIRCISGQYAGAEFSVGDGEALCFGSDPNLAHLVFPVQLAAPLHMEITFQKAEGNYLLAHRQSCPVDMKGHGRIWEEMKELPAGAEISFGSGSEVQTFRLL